MGFTALNIKDRIERYDLAENEDYVVFTEIGENSKGGRPKKEYALTLDAAKELSMVEEMRKGNKLGNISLLAKRN